MLLFFKKRDTDIYEGKKLRILFFILSIDIIIERTIIRDYQCRPTKVNLTLVHL